MLQRKAGVAKTHEATPPLRRTSSQLQIAPIFMLQGWKTWKRMKTKEKGRGTMKKDEVDLTLYRIETFWGWHDLIFSRPFWKTCVWETCIWKTNIWKTCLLRFSMWFDCQLRFSTYWSSPSMGLEKKDDPMILSMRGTSKTFSIESFPLCTTFITSKNSLRSHASVIFYDSTVLDCNWSTKMLIL